MQIVIVKQIIHSPYGARCMLQRSNCKAKNKTSFSFAGEQAIVSCFLVYFLVK